MRSNAVSSYYPGEDQVDQGGLSLGEATIQPEGEMTSSPSEGRVHLSLGTESR